jgi:hypothetical protein
MCLVRRVGTLSGESPSCQSQIWKERGECGKEGVGADPNWLCLVVFGCVLMCCLTGSGMQCCFVGPGLLVDEQAGHGQEDVRGRQELGRGLAAGSAHGGLDRYAYCTSCSSFPFCERHPQVRS